MLNTWSRRSLLKISTFVVPLLALVCERELSGARMSNSLNESHEPVSDLFPTQAPELIRETVTVAHFDLNRVKELVEARPSLGAQHGIGDLATGRAHWGPRRTWGTGRLPNT
jgi:hypothetical protein